MNSNIENFNSPKRVGILANHMIPQAMELGEVLKTNLDSQNSWWIKNINDLEGISNNLDETDLIITIGGDGTILRAAHISALKEIPILGINMGTVGFMCEIEASDCLEELPNYLDGSSIIEKRMDSLTWKDFETLKSKI